MIVVSNTSPITNLAAISQLNLLRQLYNEITIPQGVYNELTSVGYPVSGSVEVQTLEWFQVRQVSNSAQVDELRRVVDAGEAEAIVLALELSAERLLIDEAAGRALAQDSGLKITGVLGILLIAKQRQLISTVKIPLNDLMQQAGFRVSPALYQTILNTAQE